MENEQNKFFELEAKDIVTRNPKTVPLTAKLLEAEQLMTQHKINSLLVEENGLVRGIIQIYDL
jgi:arabinose-5-phosphate isomerase